MEQGTTGLLCLTLQWCSLKLSISVREQNFLWEKHGKLLWQYHFNFNSLDAASLCTKGDVQVLTLAPNTTIGLFNHWRLGRGHNMTLLASSLFQSNDTMWQQVQMKSLNAKVTQNWPRHHFLNPMQWGNISMHTLCSPRIVKYLCSCIGFEKWTLGRP